MVERIKCDFIGGMENIRNNFYLSFLTVLALNNRPFDSSVWIQSFEGPGVIDNNSLNKIAQDSLDEYLNAIRRHALNDMVICYERHASKLFLLLKDDKMDDPALIENRCNYPVCLESSKGLLLEDDKVFLEQLRRLRNSIVHYNGVYNKSNVLDYVFLKNRYYSKGHEGENISIDFESVMYIYHRLLDLFTSVCDRLR